jgi:hypothetical protein
MKYEAFEMNSDELEIPFAEQFSQEELAEIYNA